MRQAQTAEAATAFERAIEAVPGYPVAIAARSAVAEDAQSKTSLDDRLGELRDQGAVIEAAFAEATYATLTGHPDRAARVLYAALDQASAGSHGWTVPVDPLLQVNAHPEHWGAVLTLLRSRAA